MTTTDFLKVQLRHLIAQFGRRAVLEVFAGLSDVPPEQLQEEIARLETARRVKSPKRDKSLDELFAELSPMTEQTKSLVIQLGRLFEAKVFLPNLRNAEEFLRRRGAASRKFKSRKEVIRLVLKVLSQIPVSELESLAAQNTNPGGHSDYANFANQLMGKKAVTPATADELLVLHDKPAKKYVS